MTICHPIYDEKSMKLALRRAIYSAILSTEATATFMLLPASGRHMISNPFSELLNAYLHLCYKLGTIPKANLPTTNPNHGPARKLSSPSIPGTYKLL
eukprot:54690-Pelagomonas_calceolata.AAC.1